MGVSSEVMFEPHTAIAVVPLPEPDLCGDCETRPAYQHGVCKACHDNRWYRNRCVDCLVYAELPPKPKLPPVDLDESHTGRPRTDNPVKPYRPRSRREPDYRTREERARDNGHPSACHCGFCDLSQPIVMPGRNKVRGARGRFV